MKTLRFSHIHTMYKQHHYGCHYIMLLNMAITSGLSILIHGIISLPEALSYDKQDKVK